MKINSKKYYYNEDEIEFWQDLEEIFGINEETDEDFETVKEIWFKNKKEKYFENNLNIEVIKYNNKEIILLEDLQEEIIYLIIKEK